ncbi:MAG: nucleotide exchange factor GrpE [Actinomycetota bacterium]|nr:nucleotide exchange factor GrpE [Actinomycetota bacterium]
MDEPRRIPVVDKRVASAPPSETSDPVSAETSPTGRAGDGDPGPGDDASTRTAPEPAEAPPTGGDEPDFPEVVGEPVAPAVADGEAEKRDFLDDLQRLQADFNNYRKRMMREQAATAARATARVLESLLPVLDNFERGLQHDEATGGMELVYKELKTALEAQGLEEIPAEGVPFDPHVHEAVDSREDPEVQEAICRSVYRRGYKLGDQVLRAAMVVVARPVDASESGAEAAEG